ncbi:hypothetical protein SZN_21301 [Streptomyces zinciresistens K42]|uniref:Putative zinc-finger domain-containing protein n=1 Tax=Streptomyces zinciresistens K42 TaxID=700597 RepID=G2GFH6_9ACTN|nr:zf-HC2 domain-containing protein [Streptomyces zinciresistens]EGX57728.1 hypothetical protein SZN_21301 [Streptomyces zinciresistens K42]
MREDLGAHTLGALEPEESAQISAHLAACPACRAEHAELAEVAALLSALLPMRTTGPGPEPAPLTFGRGKGARGEA